MFTTEGDSFSARSENVSGASNALTDPLPKIKKDTKIKINLNLVKFIYDLTIHIINNPNRARGSPIQVMVLSL